MICELFGGILVCCCVFVDNVVVIFLFYILKTFLYYIYRNTILMIAELLNKIFGHCIGASTRHRHLQGSTGCVRPGRTHVDCQ
jgi:hypothetical protein